MSETKRIKAPIHIPTLLACSMFASKDEARFYLQGVYVEVRTGGMLYCATDGHRLLSRFIEDEDVDASDFLIIPTRVCKTWTRPKADQIDVGTLTTGALEASICFDEITVSFTPVQGTYPHFASVIPSDYSGETAQFNGLYLADFEKAAKILGTSAPVLHHNGVDPTAVSFGTSPDIIGVVMPTKRLDENFARPDWLDKTKGTVGAMPEHDPETGEIIEDKPVADSTDAIRTVSEAHA